MPIKYIGLIYRSVHYNTWALLNCKWDPKKKKNKILHKKGNILHFSILIFNSNSANFCKKKCLMMV